MKGTTRLFALLALGAIACWPAKSASAQTLLYDMAGPSGSPIVYLYDTTAGFSFTLSNSKTLTGLGYWDLDSDGLAISHPIGIWDSSGTLLATATVTNGSSAVASADGTGQWLFESIASIALGAGTYTMGSWGTGFVDQVRYDQGTTTMSDATITANSLFILGSSLARPTNSGTGWAPNGY